MNENVFTLTSILDRSWRDLAMAIGEPRHPFRLGQFATVVPDRGVDVRTVVLRRVDRDLRQLWFYSDRRSDKIAEIAADPRVSWMFYDPMMRVQLRWSGRAQAILDGEIIEECWTGLNGTQREEFMHAASPGTILAGGVEGPTVSANRRSVEEASAWFCVIEVTVSRLDWLKLDVSGHLRARFDWNSSGESVADWVVP